MANPENAAENTFDAINSKHRTGSSVELDSASGGGSVVESLEVVGLPREIRVAVQGATGNYSVEVSFDNTSIFLQSGASTDLNVEQPVYTNSSVDVTISDDSGVSNTIDYDILLV